MLFWKMNGAGNDFIIINNLDGKINPDDYGSIASILCERHLSIGADGLMFIEPSTNADLKMCFYNSDGSEGEMCGNGARCICRYAYENRFANNKQCIETVAGIVYGYRIDNSLYRIRLNNPSVLDLRRRILISDIPFTVSYVELGSPGIPHAVVELLEDRFPTIESLKSLAKQIRNHNSFPKGANVNFYKIIDQTHISLITYERGVEDFTYACGTGTGATVLVLNLLGLVNNSVSVYMRGGTLLINLEKEADQLMNLWLTGPTNVVAKGEVTDSIIINKEYLK